VCRNSLPNEPVPPVTRMLRSLRGDSIDMCFLLMAVC
jgi:hypothetical protein